MTSGFLFSVKTLTTSLLSSVTTTTGTIGSRMFFSSGAVLGGEENRLEKIYLEYKKQISIYENTINQTGILVFAHKRYKKRCQFVFDLFFGEYFVLIMDYTNRVVEF